ncbi:MAG TPA: RsmE family RNA methyltransferase, partial [Cytophagales bacterium]|nr:RsmE family RNA methyltransferase [Cytophagales bacterium]
MHLFFSKEISGTHAFLPEDESLHAIKVLRLSENSEIGVIDGHGGYYHCKIIKPHAKRCELQIIKQEQHQWQRPRYVHIAIAPTKNSDRIEWFVEKAVEIGIDKITFLQCERSERKSMNMDRTERVALAALKQSQQYFIPEMIDMMPFKAFIESHKDMKNKYIGHLHANDRKNLSKEVHDKDNILILIGPEGDFS